MAVVQGVKEKVHLPIYDSLTVEPEEQFRKASKSTSTLKFFVDVQGKTKLETNLQSAGLLPHYNTFEARAMRVVISDLRPIFSPDVDVDVEEVEFLDTSNNPVALPANTSATLSTDLKHAMELLEKAREDSDGVTTVQVADEDFTDQDGGPLTIPATADHVDLTVDDLVSAIEAVENGKGPPLEQIKPANGTGTSLITKLIYNSVTTLFVGEKIMIQMPTWFFPAGAGTYSEGSKFTSHGEPSPTATFRFAEPIFVDKQQNFRVEIEIPDADTLKDIQKVYGPLFIWVVLDGYMTRDVQ